MQQGGANEALRALVDELWRARRELTAMHDGLRILSAQVTCAIVIVLLVVAVHVTVCVCRCLFLTASASASSARPVRERALSRLVAPKGEGSS